MTTRIERRAMTKHRLDQLVVDRGLAESRERAQALILAGQVIVNGQKSSKPGHSIADDARIEVLERMPYVSRGGYKLAAALDHFSLDPTGWTCLDVGASTGGFTDCLLQRGAAKVWAIDVGHGQFDWRLRNDPRVVVQEGVNARYLNPADYPVKFDLAVCDASFISTTLLIPAFVPLLAAPRRIIVLVKPQFEVGRADIGKGGIVRDPELHQSACARVRNAVKAQGLDSAIIPSPILGTEGNREFLLYGHD
jgi:23S rRNA (cytidine1920-2'-O)/16S rRNA (cytidine1409-2'-O)-methyltransferase